MSTEQPPDHVQTWESYWEDRLVRSDGSLDLAQVMKELHDYQALKAAFLERLESEIAAVRAGIIKGIRHYFAPADSYDGVDLDDDVRILCGRIERGEY